jgi:DNA-binding response OmpR family regulator
MPAQRILVVEDEDKTAETVRLYLEHAGFEVTCARDGRSALTEARRFDYSLVVLDLMLPGIDGLTVCRRLRAETSARIVILTARTTESDRVRGLEIGADDYVTKPFSPRELVARVRAVLRRGVAPESPPPLRLPGGLDIDRVGRRVRIAGQDIPLTATEFDLLRALAESPGRVFRRDELIERVLGTTWEGSERTIDAHVAHLRRKLQTEGGPRGVETVFGVGYRLSDDA